MQDRLDDKVNESTNLWGFPPQLNIDDQWNLRLLHQIALNSDQQLNSNVPFLREKLNDPDEGHSLREKLAKAWQGKKYQSIRDIAYLRSSVTPSRLVEGYGFRPSEEATATENAWRVDYIGEAARLLLDHIKDFLPHAKRDNTDHDFGQLYARCTAIIQSSGMGKSRTVDEIAKSELVIPIVLRLAHSTGYPPPDSAVRNFLTEYSSGTLQRAVAFLHALFEEVASVAKSTRAPPKGLAPLDKSMPFPPQFREYMNYNITMNGHGDFRRQFYEDVVHNARGLMTKYEGKISTIPGGDNMTKDASDLLNAACTKLIDAIKDFPDKHPFVILSFDEIHVLEEHFLPFRRVLRALLEQPVFSLFLSTAGHMHKFISNTTMDPSARMVSRGRVIPPFSELGFDHFAKLNFQDAPGGDMLSYVSGIDQLVKFGRPLWATRYDEGDSNVHMNIIIFAASKLLGGISPDPTKFGPPHRLACLAQRLPIEFLSTSYSSSLAGPQTEQVRSHLRVVIRVVDGMETMVTASPSEPILSEAAYWLMSFPDFKPADALKSILGGFSVHSGDRGELLVMLLFTIARDKAVGPPDIYGSPQRGARWCSVNNFLSSLFVESSWATIGDRKLSMEKALGDSKLYFSHFVKVHQFAMLNAEYIVGLMMRGAAIVGATCQEGVDLLIPFTRGDLRKEDLGVILVQVKNDQKYTANPKLEEIEKMSIKGLSNIPTLRFFFALAAKRPIITPVDIPSRPPATFDFWVAGLSSKILRPVGDEEDAVWSGLLDASRGWDEIYVERGHGEKQRCDGVTNLRRSMYPGGGMANAHWKSWCQLPAEDVDLEEEEDMAVDE